MPVVKTCCFCCSLRVGSIIISILFLVVHFITVVGALLPILFPAGKDCKEGDEKKGCAKTGVADYISLVLVFLLLINASCLLYSVIAEKRKLLIWCWGIEIAVIIPQLIFQGLSFGIQIYNGASKQTKTIVLIVMCIIGMILYISFFVYCFLILFCYYQELRDEDERR